MTQRELHREIARSTGESVDFIRNFGFTEVCVPAPCNRTSKGSRVAVKARLRYRRVRRHQPQALRAA